MASIRNRKRIDGYYSGEVNKLFRDGFGVYVYPKGFFRYEGEWKIGKKHGRGKLTMKDGSFYEGEFLNGEIEGNGFRYWAYSGDSYSGQFSCGELHGCGVMQYSNGERFEGQFCYGLRDGHGILLDKEGQTYEGSFHEDKKHGLGQMNYRNGDRYEGDWIQDQRQGHGVMRFDSGSVYEGQWRNNLFNGQGTLIHCSGVVYEGLWSNGSPVGAASKIVIKGGDKLKVCEDSAFTLEVELQTKDGEKATGENGRVLQVMAGVQLVGLPPSSASANNLKRIQDRSETPIATPFGFEVISYPLMEGAFESQDSRGEAPVAEAKSGFAQADAPVPEGEWKSGNGSDSMGLGRDTPSYLNGKMGSGTHAEGIEGSTSTIESCPGQFGQEEDSNPPPANQRVEAGQAKFRNILLAPFVPYVLDKKTAKKPTGKGLEPGQSSLKSTESAESRMNVGARFGASPKRDGLDGRYGKTGEYVLMVKEVTSPPFLGQTLPTGFVHLHVVPYKNRSRVKIKDK